MKKRRFFNVLLFAALSMELAGTLHSQAAPPPLWTSDTFRSSILGETRALRISLPVKYDAPESAAERYPVLFVLDAQADIPFTAAVANARALAATNAPAIPRLLIVGIETPDSTRFHNMTPIPVGDASKRMPNAGGASAFLRFLRTELHPYIASRYRTGPVTILAGHSLTAAFTAWAFGQAPDFLTGGIALSPSLQWLNPDGFAGSKGIDAVRERATSGRLFVVYGAAEKTLGKAVQQFIAEVKNHANSTWVLDYERLDEVAHNHVSTLGMIPGLRFIFRPVSLADYQLEFDADEAPLPKFNAVFGSTRERYLRGARELGLPERLPFSFLNDQSYWYRSRALAPLLLRLCEEMIKSYPTLWQGYDCAGDAQTRLDRMTEAAANYRRAAEVARKAGDNSNADRLEHKIQKP